MTNHVREAIGYSFLLADVFALITISVTAYILYRRDHMQSPLWIRLSVLSIMLSSGMIAAARLGSPVPFLWDTAGWRVLLDGCLAVLSCVRVYRPDLKAAMLRY